MQMPPGSAIPSRRAATLTLSPSRSSPSTTTSPTLIPTRNSIRFSVGTSVLRSSIPRCTSRAQRRASTTEGNYENSVAGGFHDAAAIKRNGGIDQLATQVSQALDRALLIEPSQSRIARHISGEDCGKLSRYAHRSNARLAPNYHDIGGHLLV